MIEIILVIVDKVGKSVKNKYVIQINDSDWNVISSNRWGEDNVGKL